MKSSEKQQFSSLNIHSCLLCLLVMFIHVASAPLGVADRQSLSYLLLVSASRASAFVVPGFVFLSAFKLFCGKPPKSYLNYMAKKIKVIYLPYLLWNFLYYLNFCFVGYFHFSWKELLTYCLDGTITAPFYFVVFLMQFYLLLPLWQWLFQKNAMVVISLSAVITFWGRDFLAQQYFRLFSQHFLYFDRIFLTYLLYWTLGAYCGKQGEAFFLALKKYWIPLALGFLVTGFLNVFYFYRLMTTGWLFPHLELILQLYAVFALLFTLFLCQFVPYIKPLQAFSSITFPVYLNHCLILFYVNKWVETKGVTDLAVSFFLRLGLVYALSIGLNWLWFWLVAGGKKRWRIWRDASS